MHHKGERCQMEMNALLLLLERIFEQISLLSPVPLLARAPITAGATLHNVPSDVIQHLKVDRLEMYSYNSLVCHCATIAATYTRSDGLNHCPGRTSPESSDLNLYDLSSRAEADRNDLFVDDHFLWRTKHDPDAASRSKFILSSLIYKSIGPSDQVSKTCIGSKAVILVHTWLSRGLQ